LTQPVSVPVLWRAARRERPEGWGFLDLWAVVGDVDGEDVGGVSEERRKRLKRGQWRLWMGMTVGELVSWERS
jgi:hypothetical protein